MQAMAVEPSFQASESENFKALTSKLACMVYRDDERFKSSLNQILDQLNALEYSMKIVVESDAYGALCQCCMLIPVKHELLVTKACQLIGNLVLRQQIPLNQSTFDLLLEYLVDALHNCHPWALPEILRALGAILYENGPRAHKFHDVLIGDNGILIQLVDTDVKDEDIRRGGIQCMENICMRTAGPDVLADAFVQSCFHKFVDILHTPKSVKTDEITFCRLIVAALKGINNILLWHKTAHVDLIGQLLAALKVYMLYGLPGQAASIASCLHPSPSSILPVIKSNTEPTKPTTSSAQSKNTKKKPKKKRTKKSKEEEDEEEQSVPLNSATDIDIDHSVDSWNQISSSESEVSDTEGGQASKLRSVQAKVRHTSLICLHSVTKVTDKRSMSGYWSHFLPDAPSSSVVPTQTLFTIVLKDMNVKARIGALAVLTALLDGSKPFLAAADDSNQGRTAFTPFSSTLGAMIKEIHRCLLLGLSSENASLTITQLIKCLSTLVQNVPYHRLKPGLLSRAVRQVKPFLHHRDPNVRVGCLTFLGSVVSVQVPLVEVCHIVQASRPATGESNSYTPKGKNSDTDIDASQNQPATLNSGETTPIRGSSGCSTPTTSSRDSGCSSWLVKLCINSVLAENNSMNTVEARPVRLEALQVLSNLVKGYFPTVRDDFAVLRDVGVSCLEGKEPAIQLHGAKLLEELGNVLLPPTPDKENKKLSGINEDLVLDFWQRILNGPLQGVLQHATHQTLRATCCDCISTIGAPIFQQLPIDKRLLCITLLLGLISDEDKNVRGAALRALGIYVLFPCLREDVSFVADVANGLLIAMGDDTISVRAKAAWSLGNLSDAICANKDNDDEMFLEDFSDMLLLKIISVATKGSQDSDKVKCNAVRALGNLLRYMPDRCIEKSNFQEAVSQAIQSLTKNVATGTMKVRWNACYALGNMFKNDLLPLGSAQWTDTVFSTLCAVVKDCKNFKVKINASLSLSIPRYRKSYGNPESFGRIWIALADALLSSEMIEDFAEYKYKNNLLEQACGSLVHLACLLDTNDVLILSQVLLSQTDHLLMYMDKYKHILLNSNAASLEKEEKLKQAFDTILRLNDSVGTEDKMKGLLDILAVCFKPLEKSSVVMDEDGLVANDLTSKRSGTLSFREVYD
ncbi:HEAT repeat-containing protein 6-like [Tubulanus polymorphus]|uniref:HEAT repeat-containing protein 6-like n=1 Tax=Tubulanus polymorphus TaxID=672921 RepID=UPI003DA24FF1